MTKWRPERKDPCGAPKQVIVDEEVVQHEERRGELLKCLDLHLRKDDAQDGGSRDETSCRSTRWDVKRVDHV